MLKKIFAVLVVVTVILVGVWLFSGIEQHGQFVSVNAEPGVYPFGHCYLGVMLRAIWDDGSVVMLHGDITITSPDNDIHNVYGSSASASDNFCDKDWTVDIEPDEYENPNGGYKLVTEGKPYSYTTAVDNAHSEIVTFTFEWK